MDNQQDHSCIDACNACAIACKHCADACLHEPEIKAMARCIALDIDCAVICQLAAAAMARDSTAARGICALVVDVCTDCSDCADECAAVLMNKHIFEYERESP